MPFFRFNKDLLQIHRRYGKGMTQAQLARKIGISVPYLCYLETGTRQPSPKMIQKIARALGIGKETLMLVENPDAPVS